MTKVLMLGWEFPPLFSGGLGIATYGIVKSLRPLSHIRLIIPTSGEKSTLDGVNIIGLNNITTEDIAIEKIEFSLKSSDTDVYEVPVHLSPYHHVNDAIVQPKRLERLPSEFPGTKLDAIRSIFSGQNIYGSDILNKVHLFARLAAEIASDGDFEIIHAHDWVTFPAALCIKMNSGRPLVLHVHALETDRSGEHTRNEIYHLEHDAMVHADHIISVSEHTKAQIVKHYGIDSTKITIVHNGIEPASHKRAPHKLKDSLVVFLGRLTQQKGPKFLLETAEKVSRVHKRVKFIVAGTGDQFAPLLESSAFKKLGEKFIFAGFLSKAKVNHLLAMADVYFMPSVSEPFGLTALEAAQHKVPCVISAQSGAAEVMKASLQANFWDTDKYANYIHALLKYKALGKELSDQAEQGLTHLTWDHTAKKIHHIYRDTINHSAL
jgi:glycogen synthase